jgi:hypothetical protein
MHINVSVLKKADTIFESYKLNAILHFMNSWTFDPIHNQLVKDIHIGVKDSEEFIKANFFITLDSNKNFVSCYAYHKNLNLGDVLNLA